MLVSFGLVSRFRHMIEREALEFLFQPIVDVDSAAIIGYEALMRGPEGPLRSPEELLRVAKLVGMTVELELAACAAAVAAFGRRKLPGKLFLNVSATTMHQFAREEGGVLLRRALESGLPPSRIVLELTEHERVDDADALQKALGVLVRLGIELALDDFGDGRSSLRLWVQLKPQMVKLDKFFVRDVHRDNRKLEVLRGLQRLSNALGTPLVAEGVEEAAELAVLRDLGCRYVQGCFLGRPLAQPAAMLGAGQLAVLKPGQVPPLSRSKPEAPVAA